MLPFLFTLLVTFQRLVVRTTVERLLLAMLLTACAVSIYTEFWPILAGLLVVFLAGNALTGRAWKLRSALGVPILLAPVLLSPLSLPNQLGPLQRLSTALLPEYYRSRLPVLPELVWLGVEFRSLGWNHGKRPLSVVLMGLSILGLGGLVLRQWRRSWRRPAFLLVLGVLALSCLPVLALLRRPLNPYPIFKLTLTCGPLLVLGLSLLLPRLRVAVLLLAATGTVLMEYESTWHHHSPYPHMRSLMSDDFRWAEGQLEHLESGEVFLAVEKMFHAPCLAYRGRHHPMWLLPRSTGDLPLPPEPPAGTPVYLLVEDSICPSRTLSGRGQLLATRGRFSLWQWEGVPSIHSAP
jgi:hypothetical protein